MGTNRKLPFGYRMDFGRIAVQPEEARWVRYIFSQYNQGMPFSAITDKMRNSSMPYDGDKQWNKNMIARILEDHRYCGDREYPEIIDGATFQQTAERRKKKSAPRRQTEAQSALRKKCAGKMTPYIEHEVLYLLNCLARNPERIVTPQTPRGHSHRLDTL
ncbi:MAG: recombinase family protein, partial [Fusicatenibacter sp.]